MKYNIAGTTIKIMNVHISTYNLLVKGNANEKCKGYNIVNKDHIENFLLLTINIQSMWLLLAALLRVIDFYFWYGR